MNQFLMERNPIILENEIDETIKKIIDVLNNKIRPAVAKDGGDIKFKSFENGVVKVELTRKLFWLPKLFNDSKARCSKSS